MLKPNWDIFKAKFSENPENNFEWFCYILFCKEFNRPFGIHRYKNQSAIETDPIEVNGELVGWQAKFYETTLSKHKNDFISMIEGAKKDYPGISKLIIYTNQEWGQNKGKDPKSKKDVEDKAKELNIELVWKPASFFESSFVTSENEIIAYHFFSLNESILDRIKEQQRHTEFVLSEIQTDITFRNQSIEIDRGKVLEQIKTSPQVLIVSGGGGVGKTAVIKKLYENSKNVYPIYIFKATEFGFGNINDIFTGFNFQDFINAHKDETSPTVIIDSAEKILDLKNRDPFKEFLSILMVNNWKIIFTTRDNYLGDLNYEFSEIYKIVPLNINLPILGSDELVAISSKFNFSLPKDEKLLNIIKIPFYLSKYLKFYKEDSEISYMGFREDLWNGEIKKAKPAREQCFLKVAFERVNSGHFFVTPNCETQILDDELGKDGILGYESPHGYFITHDIYEEWALEKIIENEFVRKPSVQIFFDGIGESLPIRRSFRKWVSEKLLLKDNAIKGFIEEVLGDEGIESFWKDEILVSVLLSDYSETFFEIFEDELLRDNQEWLKKATFLLRIACKEVDDDFFKQLGIKKLNNMFSLKYVLTKPKGQGWNSLIKFVFEHLANIGIKNIDFILPVINDWNRKFKSGATTRFSSLIALRYYQWVIDDDVHLSRDDASNHILPTIINGSPEIQKELADLFELVIKNRWKNYRDPYYDLVKTILTKLEGIDVAKVLPGYVLQLADLFWTYSPKNGHSLYGSSRMGVEQYFGVEDDHTDYFPESSYQTPIYWLLQFSLKETIDFILSFTNRAVKRYAESDLDKHEPHEVDVFFDGGISSKQYISSRLWGSYRGLGVSPNVFASIHMALEKFFLEIGKHADTKLLAGWLSYLLENSKSASITAVVTSIVLAYPEKTFDVAKILFRTKEFILYDTSRMVADLGQKSSLLAFKNSFGGISRYEDEVHEDERLKACDDEHRKWALEHQFLKYQLFKDDETSDAEAKNRQDILWEILDNYYKALPDPSQETEADKTWRLFLARMDRRKMNLTTERTDGGLIINLNPEIEPELKEYSEKTQQKSLEPMKYTSLMLWASYRMRSDEKYKQYEKYEQDPLLALKEAQEIAQKLQSAKVPQLYQFEYSEEEAFFLYNHSIPSDVCSVLVRDYSSVLSDSNKEFCKNIILDYASLFLHENYRYQISDGTQSAISVLPLLISENSSDVKVLLLLALFNDYPVDMAHTRFSAFSIMAIQKLWGSNLDDAQSLLFGYLIFKPKYDAIRKRLFSENHKRGVYEVRGHDVTKAFLEENETELEKVVENKLPIGDLEGISKIDLEILRTAFQLIPQRTNNEVHKKLAKGIISAFAEELLSKDRDRNDKVEYMVRHDFLEKFAWFVLSSPKEEIAGYLTPVLSRFNNSEIIADLLKEFVYAEDHLNEYENFWEVWNLFRSKIVELCKKGDSRWYTETIIMSYLFAQTPWKETATEWHTLKDENKRFFRDIVKEIGHCPSALYSISKLLNDIGSSYLTDGVSWISYMLGNNKELLDAKLETNTLYYLENLVKKYVYENREEIKRTKKLKQDVLLILDFLTERSSVVGYLLRENML
ncbi:MAG: ATP-binding protein [Alphaproteobacteria bacterium]|nr:MAG: ATP-binding protein [Alphaproteobacteria bacterium]